MKITDFKTFVVGNPPPHFGGKYWIFVKLTTDSGISGYGEVYSVPFHPEDRGGHGRGCLRAPPGRMGSSSRSSGSGGSSTPAASPSARILRSWACSAASRRPAGTSSARPWTSRSTSCSAARSTSGCAATATSIPRTDDAAEVYNDPDHGRGQRAVDYVKRGFTAVKFDPAGPYTAFDPRQLSLEELDRSERFVEAIREAVGTDCDLLFGTHGQMTTSGAIRLARRLEPYDPLWFEEPTPPERPEEMARVARQTSIPIATGERLATKYEFARVLENQAASILQMALGRVGGLLEGKKIAGMAEAHYAQIAPHLYCGPIEGAANVQLSACSPNFLILESIQDWGGFHSEILKTPMRWEEGYVIPPTAPGIGVELDEEVAARHPYEGTALHLEMLDRPL